MNNKPNNVVATLKFHRFVYRGYACRGCAACILRKKKKKTEKTFSDKGCTSDNKLYGDSPKYTADSGIDVVQGINEQVLWAAVNFFKFFIRSIKESWSFDFFSKIS